MSAHLDGVGSSTDPGVLADSTLPDSGANNEPVDAGLSKSIDQLVDESIAESQAGKAAADSQPQPGQKPAEPSQAQTAEGTYRRYQDGVSGIAKLLYDEEKFKEWEAEKDVNKRFQGISEALKSHRDKLEEYELAGEDFGIKLDAPVDEIDFSAQLDELPKPYFNKLLSTVYKENFEGFVQETLKDPETNKDEYGMLQKATSQVAEKVYGRPVQEVNSIIYLTRGLTPVQLYQILAGSQGQGQNGDQGYVDPSQQGYQPGYGGPPQYGGAPITPVPPVAGNQHIYGTIHNVFSQAGLDMSSPAGQQAARLMAGMLTDFDTKFQDQERRLTEYMNETKAEKQTRLEQEKQQRVGTVEGEKDALYKDAINRTLKGRVSDADLPEVSRWVYNDAIEDIRNDPKIKTKLDLARGFAESGLPDKARVQLGLAAGFAERHIQRIASKMLEKLVVKVDQKGKEDQARGANKTLAGAVGAGGVGGLSPKAAQALARSTVGMSAEDIGNLAVEIMSTE